MSNKKAAPERRPSLSRPFFNSPRKNGTGEGYHDPADLEQQDPKIQAVFRLVFAVYERADRQADRLERERQAFAEMAHKILSASSQRLLEQELHELVEEEERRRRRRKRYPHPGGFDARKALAK